jgi:ATP-dependent DNA helicase
MYHGSKDERAEMRATRLQPPSAAGVGKLGKGKPGARPSGTKSYKAESNTSMTFPVVVTTYEICMNDRQFLSGFLWKYIVVDEGHRLKNLDCRWVIYHHQVSHKLTIRLIRELKTYTSANRLILTGTPLHVS